MEPEFRAFYYDKDEFNGHERLYKNARLIASLAPPQLRLKLDTHGRFRRAGSEPGIYDLLLQQPLPYEAVIVNRLASHVEDVVEAAKYALECNLMTQDRLLLFGPRELHDSSGAQYVVAHGGHSYLLPDDARQIVRILEGIKTCRR